MLLVYTFLLLLLGVANFLIRRRVASLEKKFARVATAADKLLRSPQFREGNSGRPDPCQVAKRQYQLALLAHQQDKLEAKHDAWERYAEKSRKLVGAVRGWKGKTVPYTFGVVDVLLLFTLIDYLGLTGYVSGRHLVELITAWFANG
jgi:hypothetical protein